MVAILVTAEIRALLVSANLSHQVTATAAVCTVSHTTLCAALRAARDPVRLSSLLAPASLHPSHAAAVAQLAPRPRDAAVAARVARLQARLHEAQYARITRDVSRAAAASPAEVESLRMSKLAPQMSLAANVIVAMATCFTVGYFLAKNSLGSEAYGLVGGVAGLIVAMGVEVVLLMTRMYAVDKEARKQRGKREKKAERNVEAE